MHAIVKKVLFVCFYKFDNFHDIRPTFRIYYVIFMFLGQEKFKFMQRKDYKVVLFRYKTSIKLIRG